MSSSPPSASMRLEPLAALKRRVNRVLESVGIHLYWIRHDDRRVLESLILPALGADPTFRRVLFVGCDWYTQPYGRFFRRKDYWTLDVMPEKRQFGASQHITDTLANLSLHFAAGSLDLIVCNGVFGWGLNERDAVEQAFAQCFESLRPEGLFLLGWNDIPERRPFPLAESASLSRFTPAPFAPLQSAEYRTQTPYRHVFSFFRKR